MTVSFLTPSTLVTGFDVELNPENHHPTAESQHRLAVLLADRMPELLGARPSAATPPAP